MNWYLKNSVEIIQSGEKDPDLILMAKETIRLELSKIAPYIEECRSKGIEPLQSILDSYNTLIQL